MKQLNNSKVTSPLKISPSNPTIFHGNIKSFFRMRWWDREFNFRPTLWRMKPKQLNFSCSARSLFWREWNLLIIYGAMELVKTQNMLEIMKKSFRRSDSNLPKGIHGIFHSFPAKGAKRQPFKPVTLNINSAFGEENEASHSDHFWRQQEAPKSASWRCYQHNICDIQ